MDELIITNVFGQSYSGIIEEDWVEFELSYCDRCMQMNNHKNGECQKCKNEK